MATKKSVKKDTGESQTVSHGKAGVQLPPGAKVVRQVITPTLSLKIGEPHTVKILEPMHESTYSDPKRTADKGKAQKKATICAVIDVESGEQRTLLVPSVLESSLKEGYPGDGYVQKAFYIEKLPKRPGKDYFDCKCIEVDVSGMEGA